MSAILDEGVPITPASGALRPRPAGRGRKAAWAPLAAVALATAIGGLALAGLSPSTSAPKQAAATPSEAAPNDGSGIEAATPRTRVMAFEDLNVGATLAFRYRLWSADAARKDELFDQDYRVQRRVMARTQVEGWTCIRFEETGGPRKKRSRPINECFDAEGRWGRLVSSKSWRVEPWANAPREAGPLDWSPPKALAAQLGATSDWSATDGAVEARVSSRLGKVLERGTDVRRKARFELAALAISTTDAEPALACDWACSAHTGLTVGSDDSRYPCTDGAWPLSWTYTSTVDGPRLRVGAANVFQPGSTDPMATLDAVKVWRSAAGQPVWAVSWRSSRSFVVQLFFDGKAPVTLRTGLGRGEHAGLWLVQAFEEPADRCLLAPWVADSGAGKDALGRRAARFDLADWPPRRRLGPDHGSLMVALEGGL